MPPSVGDARHNIKSNISLQLDEDVYISIYVHHDDGSHVLDLCQYFCRLLFMLDV